MPRFDTLTSIHKAIRAMVYETGGVLQTTDFADQQEAARAAADLEPSCSCCTTITRPKRSSSSPSSGRSRSSSSTRCWPSIRRSSGCWASPKRLGRWSRPRTRGTRVAAGGDLNRRFNELIAFYFDHLAREEVEVLPATWRHFDDGELMAIQGAIVGEAEPGVTCSSGWRGCSRA